MNQATLTSEQKANIDLLNATLADLPRKERLAAMAVIGKECGFIPRQENLDYSRTSNARIRSIFGARIPTDDVALDRIKRNPNEFAELVYGRHTETGRRLGNYQENDGWFFRGRGFVQLTGRTNYNKAQLATNVPLVMTPDAAMEPANAAKIALWFYSSNVPAMAFSMRIYPTFAQQSEVNALYASAVAGQRIVRGSSFLGGEAMSQVDRWAERLEAIL